MLLFRVLLFVSSGRVDAALNADAELREQVDNNTNSIESIRGYMSDQYQQAKEQGEERKEEYKREKERREHERVRWERNDNLMEKLVTKTVQHDGDIELLKNGQEALQGRVAVLEAANGMSYKPPAPPVPATGGGFTFKAPASGGGFTFQAPTTGGGFTFQAPAPAATTGNLMLAVTGSPATGNQEIVMPGLVKTMASVAEQHPDSVLSLLGVSRDNSKVILHCIISREEPVRVIAVKKAMGGGDKEKLHSFEDLNLEWGITDHFPVANEVRILRFINNEPPKEAKVCFLTLHAFHLRVLLSIALLTEFVYCCIGSASLC